MTIVKQKPGLRGAVQKSAAEDMVGFIEKALELSMAGAFMTSGELFYFFDKATITEKNGFIEAVANNFDVSDDKFFVKIISKTNLFVYKEFPNFLVKEPVDSNLSYAKFNINALHGTNTNLNLPALKMKIEKTNQDYTLQVK